MTGRVIAVRKTQTATDAAVKKLKRDASKKQYQLKPETLEYAKYVMIFTDLSADQISTGEVLTWYRMRWQIELLFKRLKSLANTGHLPKHDDGSAPVGDAVVAGAPGNATDRGITELVG